jgi:hypothetical protein
LQSVADAIPVPLSGERATKFVSVETDLVGRCLQS